MALLSPCARRGTRRLRRAVRLVVLTAALTACMPWAPAAGGARLAAQGITQEEALRLAFPGAAVERRTAYLDADQLARATSLAGEGVEVASPVVTYYLATVGGAPVGVAYFDAHRVRTLPEVLMVVVGADGRVRRVEVVRFSEPPDYAPPPGWLTQFPGHALDPELSNKRGIANITGATLTARAVTASVRRVLALHEVLAPFAQRSR